MTATWSYLGKLSSCQKALGSYCPCPTNIFYKKLNLSVAPSCREKDGPTSSVNLGRSLRMLSEGSGGLFVAREGCSFEIGQHPPPPCYSMLIDVHLHFNLLSLDSIPQQPPAQGMLCCELLTEDQEGDGLG